MRKVLAFDFGASSGRAILGIYQNERLELKEIHRFKNQPVRVCGHLFWDILRLFHEIKAGIIKCVNEGHNDIESIAIDTWGVDYGFIDKNGHLLGNPYHYRDTRTVGMIEKLEQKLGKGFIYNQTGIQSMEFNTIYQLASMPIPQNADKLLFIPDLLAYFLTGEKKNERTILSTSQLLNPNTNELSEPILDSLAIDKNLFCPIVEAGDIFGTLTKEVAEELGINQIPVIATASHDTASAVASVTFGDKNEAYISCGTWSLLGLELKQPLINEQTLQLNFTNESGYGKSIRFIKNIIGLWLAQECRNKWEKDGQDVSFAVLDKETAESDIFARYIDPADYSFLAPPDMPKAIRDFCKKTGQSVPETKGDYLMTIVQSLAMKYRQYIEKLEQLTGQKLEIIHMVGGGIKDELLCRFTANATGKIIEAGPVEATSAGNILVQLISLGQLPDLKSGRAVIKNSLPIKTYVPENTEKWNEEYKKFLSFHC